jgi:2-dehydropantoate 2-reductase
VGIIALHNQNFIIIRECETHPRTWPRTIIRRFAVPRAVKILVFGAGAIGSWLGGFLSMKHEVTLVGRRAHVDAIRERGLRISGRATLLARVAATTQVPQDPPDVIFVTTKSYDTAAAVDALRAFWRRSTFVTLQNGLGNAERLAADAERVIAGTTTHGVTFVGPGEVVHAGTGETRIGGVKGVARADVQRLADALTAAGIPTAVTDDVRRELWAKAVVNAAINPLTAVLRVRNGDLVRHDDLRALLDRLAREGAVAARAAGVDLDPDGIAAKAAEVAARTAENRSSMLQDVERGRRTEVEAITGELLRAARGVVLPYNERVYALVRGVERTLPRGS